MNPHSLKTFFIQHINEALFQPNGIELSDRETRDLKNNLEKVGDCLKQYEKLFYEKANANELNLDELLNAAKGKKPIDTPRP